MTKQTGTADEEMRKQSQEAGSSHGKESKSVTPKDVSPQDATARDVTERKLQSDNPDEKQEELLDDAVDMTFPASDPIAIPTPADAERDPRKTHHHRP